MDFRVVVECDFTLRKFLGSHRRKANRSGSDQVERSSPRECCRRGGHAQEPKTRKSQSAVPVIARLAGRLDQHRLLSGNPTTGLMFATPTGKPINLDALVVDVIRPALTKVEVPWHGWHAFRRGLATTLHRSGVPDKTIQAILRHSNVAVTQACYIKTIAEDVTEAMRSLEYAPNMHLGEANKPRYM